MPIYHDHATVTSVRTAAWRTGVAVAVTTVMMAALAVVAQAQAPGGDLPTPIEGRWKGVDRDVTIDVVRCGKAFCGQLVRDGKCERTVVRLEPVADNGPYLMALKGAVELPDVAIPAAHANVSGQGEAIRLTIAGVPGNPRPYTRIMHVMLQLAPAGKATCPAGATS